MLEVKKTLSVFRFGPFELWTETGELRKNSVRLKLSGQPIQVLMRLVATPGKLVTREELQQYLWPGAGYGDFEKGLNAAVNRLRDSLGDSATDPKYIETVQGRGYRFIGKLHHPDEGVAPGKTVSHYRILEMIGRGGMGVVYKAEDLNLGRHVALKFLPEEFASNHEALERFRREASTASSLNHPNICTIYDIAEHEGRPFIIMELLQGQTLRDCLISVNLQRNRLELALDTGRLLDIALQVLEGLQAAHEKGIIHRDIKPANIFVTNSGLVKILDFGLAKLIGTVRTSEIETAGATSPNSCDLQERLSEVGAVIGTTGYMAPEQTKGDNVDARTDLFSLGLVLYEMGTGRPAFNGTTDAELRDAILTKTPIPIHELNPSIPETLEEVITKTLAKNRELRYQSASELRGDLLRVKQGIESGITLAPEFPSIWPGKRFLEAAAPKEATVGRSIEVIAMVRESATSGGLREFLGNEEAPNLTAEDVRERPFDLEFPVSEKGKPQPLDIMLRLESPGFDPRVQTKKLRVPPTEDSPPCAFLIVPRLVGELVINLELLSVQEQVLASRSMRTNALPAGAEASEDKIIVAIPLFLMVRRVGDQIFLEPVAEGEVPLEEAHRSGGPPGTAESVKADQQTTEALRTPQSIQPEFDPSQLRDVKLPQRRLLRSLLWLGGLTCVFLVGLSYLYFWRLPNEYKPLTAWPCLTCSVSAPSASTPHPFGPLYMRVDPADLVIAIDPQRWSDAYAFERLQREEPPFRLQFGSVSVRREKQSILKLLNDSSSEPLTITGTKIVGAGAPAFAVLSSYSPCTSQIEAGHFCILRVHFRPRKIQEYQATLKIGSIGHHINVELSGHGK